MAEEFRLKGSTAGSVNACAELDLAVLPMQNLTGDVTENYLSRSISSELWSGLYRYQALKLVPMLASFGDVGTEGDLAQISEQLNARFVLDGSFRRYGNSLRLVVQLIDLRTTENLWARDYDLGSNTEAVFRASTDIVSEIAQALNLVTADNPQGPDTEHLAAWHLVERAWYRFIESGDINDVFPLLDRAIELDPQYARALSSKAVALTALAELGGLQAKEQLLSAKKLAQQAIELDSGDPTAIALTYNVLGSVYQRLELDFPKAYEAFLITQRFDLFSAADSFSDLLINAGRYKEGLEWASRHEAAFPADGSTRIQTARFLVRLGRIDEARDKIEEALKVSPGNQWVETVAVEFFVWDLNDQERSLQILNRGYVHSTVEQFARAELARQSGDPAVMVSLIDTWIERLREEYIPFHPWLISNGLYLIGDYERHIEWFSTRTDERSHVSWINDELNYRWPDYWSKLREWSLSDPSRVRERAIMIDAHRALVDRIQEKMTLHELTRESFGLGAELARCS
jgi:TolB-like protein